MVTKLTKLIKEDKIPESVAVKVIVIEMILKI